MQILGSIPNADVGKVSVIMSVMSRLTVSQQLADIWLKVGVGELLLYSSQFNTKITTKSSSLGKFCSHFIEFMRKGTSDCGFCMEGFVYPLTPQRRDKAYSSSKYKLNVSRADLHLWEPK